MVNNRLIDHLDKLRLASSTNEHLGTLSSYLDQLGIHAFNYGFADTRNHPMETAPVEFISTIKGDWIDHYVDQRYDLIDPGVDNIREGKPQPLVIMPEMQVKSSDDKSPLRSFFSEIQELDIHSLVVAPMSSPFQTEEGFAGIGLLSSLHPAEFEQMWRANAPEIMVFLNYLHAKLSPDLKRRLDHVDPLSSRESDCLQLLAAGFRPTQIADHLFLATVTVNFHIYSARKKLKARTNAEAVAKALSYGMLQC